MQCVECKIGTTISGTTSLTFTRKDSKLRILVSGVPADVCTNCNEAYLSEEISQEIFVIVDKIFELDKTIKESALPPPQIEINFQPEKYVAA